MANPSNPVEIASSYHLLQMAMVAALLIVSLMGVRVEGGFVFDGVGLVLGRDFLNTWHYGLAAFADNPAAFYDYDFYNARLDALIPGYPDQNFSYPPHVMLLAAPFGLFGYNAALALMTALSALVFWLVVVRDFAEPAYRKTLWLLPAFALALICGQLSVLIAAVFVLVYRNLDSRPVLAGVLIALLTVKPQLGVLFPLFLIATRRWTVLVAAAAATAVFIAASLAVHGVEIWRVFLFSQLGEQSDLMFNSHPLTRGLMPSLAVGFGMLGFDKSTALALHAAVAVIAVGLMLWCAARCRDRFLQYGVFVTTSFIATPYLMAYDTVILGWVAVMLLANYGATAWQVLTYRLVIALIPIGIAMSMLGIPGYSLILLALLAYALDKTGLFAREATQPAV